MSQQQTQQHQQQQQQYSVSLQLQPQPTTSEEEEEEEGRTLSIANLHHWMDKGYLDHCFKYFFAFTGEVKTKVIRNDKSDECYGFIEFKSHAIARSFLHRYNGSLMPGGTNPFRFNWAAKVVTDDGTTTTTTGQCEVNCMFCSTTILPSIGPANKKTVGGGDSLFSTEGSSDKVRWEYMLKWWSLSQFEGTCTADTVHATHRVYEIASFLFCCPINYSCPTPGEAEKLEEMLDKLQELLDELPSHVNSIDVAKELYSMGALEPLFIHLSCKHAGVGAKAAKIVRTMVENSNPRSLQFVMEAHGGIHLLDALSRPLDATAETHVLEAITSLLGNNIPYITGFRQRYVYADLYYALCTASVDWQRKALNLIHCLVLEHKSDCNIVTGLGYHRFMMKLATSLFVSVRVAALKCLLLLTQVEGGGNSDQLVKTDDQLKQVLEKRTRRIRAMAKEDLVAAWEEKGLVASLWKSCYDKTCPLDQIVTYDYEGVAARGPRGIVWTSSRIVA